MTDYKTLRIPAEAYHEARDCKKDSETWGEFVQRCSDTRPNITELVEQSQTVSLEAVERQKIAEAVVERLR
jgi:predicted CopG family antitoxin